MGFVNPREFSLCVNVDSWKRFKKSRMIEKIMRQSRKANGMKSHRIQAQGQAFVGWIHGEIPRPCLRFLFSDESRKKRARRICFFFNIWPEKYKTCDGKVKVLQCEIVWNMMQQKRCTVQLKEEDFFLSVFVILVATAMVANNPTCNTTPGHEIKPTCSMYGICTYMSW